MPRMGFELTIPVFERAKTVHVLDRSATVIGIYPYIPPKFLHEFQYSERFSRMNISLCLLH
jgi:hypothetical protein